MAAFVAPALGFAGSLIAGLLGKHSADKAGAAQAKAAADALALEREKLGQETAANQYAMQRAHALDARTMAMKNALMRSMGASGLEDPSWSMSEIDAGPPDLTAASRPWMAGMPAQPAVTLGQLMRATGQPATAPRAPMTAAVMPGAITLGQLFRSNRPRPRG